MSRKKKGGFTPFLLGIAAALIVGWIIFPQVLYVQGKQPIHFSHELHEKHTGDCEVCHSNKEQGAYATRLPTTEDCALCHYEVLAGTPDEERLVNEYIEKDKKIPWKVYQKQPDNVYFSHLPHEDQDCTRCHPDVEDTQDMPVRYKNRITGYTRTTMKMHECERCHAREDASNACFVCHK